MEADKGMMATGLLVQSNKVLAGSGGDFHARSYAQTGLVSAAVDSMQCAVRWLGPLLPAALSQGEQMVSS